jgi:fructoselysine-6-P-deglycase FrlB-like protein
VIEVTGSSLWSDLAECPSVLSTVLDGVAGLDAAVALVRGASRVVLTGNGAALYAATTLWHAAHRFPAGPPACLVPAGLIAAGGFRWRRGDVTVAVSSSGELRDLVDLLPDGPVPPLVVLTAHAGSALGVAATAPVVVPVEGQRAVTHTQAYVGNVLVSLLLWDKVTGGAVSAELGPAVRQLPERLERLVELAPDWADRAASTSGPPHAAVVLGTAGGWTAALEAALLLKEVAGIPAEGLETREGATTGSYALSRRHLALVLEAEDDPFADEAAAICAGRGAAVVRTPPECRADPLLLALTTFPAVTALAATLGLRAGLDIDRPAWTDSYFATARSTSDPKGTS